MYTAGEHLALPEPAPRAQPGDHPPGGPGGDGRPIGVTVSASVHHRITPREGAVPWAARNSPRWRTSWGPAGCPRSTEPSRTWLRLRSKIGLARPGPGLNDPALGPVLAAPRRRDTAAAVAGRGRSDRRERPHRPPRWRSNSTPAGPPG